MSKEQILELINKHINDYVETIKYAETEEGMAELKDYEYDEARFGQKALEKLLLEIAEIDKKWSKNCELWPINAKKFVEMDTKCNLNEKRLYDD